MNKPTIRLTPGSAGIRIEAGEEFVEWDYDSFVKHMQWTKTAMDQEFENERKHMRERMECIEKMDETVFDRILNPIEYLVKHDERLLKEVLSAQLRNTTIHISSARAEKAMEAIVNYQVQLMIKAQDELGALKENLKKIEWAAVESYMHNKTQIILKSECPACHNDVRRGHKPDCWIGNALKEAKT